MANVLLIDPPWYALQNIYYDKVSYGLASLAAVLKNNRHNCVIYNGEFGLLKPPYLEDRIIIDFDLYRSNLENDSTIWKKTWENIKSIINDFRPLIIGITIPTAKYLIAIKIANQIKKEFPSIAIVVGGPHPTIQPLEIIKEASIDIVVKGEGESTFLELVNAIENEMNLKDIAGIVFKSNSTPFDNPNREYITDLDSLPFPAWDLTYGVAKHDPNSFGTVFTSRGCPFRCIYCASFKIWSRKVRYMSADRVIAELQYTSQRYKINSFRFNDDTFIIDQRRVIEICEKIKKLKLNIEWNCEVRADLCTYEILKIMKSAGCTQVNIGIESGDPGILKYIEKNITLDQIYRAFKAIRKAKLAVTAYFMVGFPNETVKQVKNSLKLMYKLRPDNAHWSIVTPYPGTELYEQVVRDGRLPSESNWSYFFHHSPAVHLSQKINYDTFLYLIDKIEEARWRIRVRGYKRRVFFLLFFHPVEFIKKVYKRCKDYYLLNFFLR